MLGSVLSLGSAGLDYGANPNRRFFNTKKTTRTSNPLPAGYK
jgi:hypothetical protein